MLISGTFQGNHWGEVNPTRTALDDVDLTYHGQPHTIDNGLGKMAGYQEKDPRTSFMSVFPVSGVVDHRPERWHRFMFTRYIHYRREHETLYTRMAIHRQQLGVL